MQYSQQSMPLLHCNSTHRMVGQSLSSQALRLRLRLCKQPLEAHQ
jgi:hypothetical protein